MRGGKPVMPDWVQSLLLRTHDKPNAAIERAREGFDYSVLAKRIRDGTASEEELSLAADVLEGRIQKPSHRPRSYEKRLLDCIIAMYVAKLHERWGEKEYGAIEITAQEFGLSPAAVRKIYKKTLAESEAAVEEIKRPGDVPKSGLR